MKLKKKIVSMCMATIMAVGVMSSNVNALNYTLHYNAGAESTSNVTSQSSTTVATGSNNIAINSTHFSAAVAGASCQVFATRSGETLTTVANIKSTGSFSISFLQGKKLKVGSVFTVTARLKSYNASRSVGANGTTSP